MRKLKIRYETLLPFYHFIWRHWRERRWEKFKAWMSPINCDKILDVGGDPSAWNGRKCLANEVDIVGLRLHPHSDRPDSPKIRVMVGDGRALDIPDGAYGIVFSNSVLEHVGDWKDQQDFASEMRRVGRCLWIQTPAFACPVEPHYLGFFIHWFPQTWHVPIARWTSVVGLTGAADLQSIADTTRLLRKSEMQQLFPDCEIWTERLFLIFPKSYVALRRPESQPLP